MCHNFLFHVTKDMQCKGGERGPKLLTLSWLSLRSIRYSAGSKLKVAFSSLIGLCHVEKAELRMWAVGGGLDLTTSIEAGLSSANMGILVYGSVCKLLFLLDDKRNSVLGRPCSPWEECRVSTSVSSQK